MQQWELWVCWELTASQRSVPRHKFQGSLSSATYSLSLPIPTSTKEKMLRCWGRTLQSKLLLPVLPAVCLQGPCMFSPTALTWHQNWMVDTVLFLFYAESDSFSVLINQWHQPKSMAGDRLCVGGWLKPDRATQPVTWRQSSKCCARIGLGFLTDSVLWSPLTSCTPLIFF